MFSLFLRGGWPMWPLLLCSIASLAIIVDRLWYFGVEIRENREFFEDAISALKQGRPLEAMQAVRKRKGPAAAILTAAIANYNEPAEDLQDAVARAGRAEIFKMEKGLPMLNGISVMSQLLGLVGTATGVMKTFNIIGNLAGVTTPTDMAPGIAMDLITTVFGLSIAVPAMAFSLVFSRQVDKRTLILNDQATAVLHAVRRGEHR